ncbi:winged helix-turn-helix domain-containing protein [Vibrio amylolyticus]|uniref:ArsR/SmtB family transcription factor n=1 Tax=Vibrio TaxID=662 RepID=UPI000C847DD6|nr:winged helix-turn-helix domain-containing protein [Vibrio sp. 10N.261.55.A7]PMK00359.1 transcriptional regulator [Vibrio sp. 10N.261.55.A7]
MTSSCTTVNQDAFRATDKDIVQEAKFAALSKALSHPARVRIIKILMTLDNLGGCLNSDLVSELGLAQSTVSEHLRILKQAEFITAEPTPPRVCYRINRSKMNEYATLLDSLVN